MKSIFEEHISQLITWFEKYFQNDNIDTFAWIQDPFNATVPSEFTAAEEENGKWMCFRSQARGRRHLLCLVS
jgi:hypothetical protein